MAAPATYIVSNLLIALLFSNQNKRYFMIIGLVLTGFALFLSGPSYYLHMPESLAMVIIGMTLLGFLHPWLCLFNIPEMTDFIEYSYPEFSAKELSHLTDFSSSMYTAFSNFFEMFAPIFGATVYEKSGFRRLSDYVAFLTIGLGLLYLICSKNVKTKVDLA